MALLEPEMNDLRRPHRRVVHATEERLQVRAAPALLGNRREQPGDLGWIWNGSRVYSSLTTGAFHLSPLRGFSVK